MVRPPCPVRRYRPLFLIALWCGLLGGGFPLEVLTASAKSPDPWGAHAAANFPFQPPQEKSSDSNTDDAKKDDAEKALPTIAERTAGLERRDGFFVTYWDADRGKMFLEVPIEMGEFLYVHSLATGLGSNPVGLDRGQLGEQRVVQFRRVGRKVLLLQPNLRYRALTEREPERNAVAQSFAESVIWGTEVVAEGEGRYLIDLESLLLSDVHGVIETLGRANQGEFTLDAVRSAIYLPRCRPFPQNVELEASLTFASRQPGPLVNQTAPHPQAVTLRQHHSFVALPEPGYQPRRYDSRAASMSMTFADYAAPLDQPLEQRWILRHRLEKKDPTAAVSEPVEPIVYYVDPGAPTQIREALVEGASWWADAFEAAGFRNAFEVRVLPPDADPLDVRYNVIQWVHRSTRGWSYGGSVIDPRTGEILKGHVTLGSLRVRQDRLLMESLLHPNGMAGGGPGSAAACGLGMEPAPAAVHVLAADPVEIALARIRQLSAHEVGHTLGFVHNFAASTYDGRASVMDYPAPLIRVNPAGQLDFSDAYAVGIGSWDKISVRYAYAQFAPETDEPKALEAILEEAADANMAFVTDADSRPPNAAHPLGNLWDNGTDPLDGWAMAWKVRQQAVADFERTRLPAGTDAADVEQYLVPVYLYHRYQLQAVGKMVGGVMFRYGPASDPETEPAPIPVARQLKAVRILWSLLTPAALRIPDRLTGDIGVKPYSQLRDQENFSGQAGGVFDPLAPARVAVDLALNELLQRERLTRWATQQAESEYPLSWLLQSTVAEVWQDVESVESVDRPFSWLVRGAVFDRLTELADDGEASLPVRAAATAAVEAHAVRLGSSFQPGEEAFRQLLRRRLQQFRNRPDSPWAPPAPPAVPPGSPIGGR